ncbi:MAG: competence/damage-inducible protein A [Bacteroidales bacterium]|nr:competence/damage-inducible protein A [Bacteroidales bacterium]
MKRAELVTIGDEILIGQIVDTNSAWISKQLHDIGIKVEQITSISDTPEAITETINASKADIIIMTGGLGPTNDDLTKKTLTQYFDTELEFHQEVYAHIQNLLIGRGVELNELNKEQALLPKNAKILPNPNGTASGMWFTNDKVQVVSLPGVPFEMKAIIMDSVIPQLQSVSETDAIVHKTVMTVGLAESMLAKRIETWEGSLPNYIKLAYLPRPGIVRLRLTAIGKDKISLRTAIDQQIETLHAILPNEIFGYDDTSIEKEIFDLLLTKKQTLSTAESCTGGTIASMITSVAGSSSIFKGGIVAYSNEAKINQLNVKQNIIESFGAVSKEVVEAMAINARKIFNTDFSIAVSGIAGPDGGSEEKPVGTTWVAVASRDHCISERFRFGEHRGRNITRASLSALNILRLLILNKLT